MAYVSVKKHSAKIQYSAKEKKNVFSGEFAACLHYEPIRFKC